MPTTKTFLALFCAVFMPLAVLTAAEKIVAGPKGGRLLETKPVKAEFFVNAERKAEINFYDEGMKPVAPDAQVVAITAEPKTGRAKLELEKTATGFVTKTALPEADAPYRVVVQIRPSAEAAPQNFRVDLNLENCAECNHAEYACTCSH